MFPGGSVTGAPKIAALDLIAELEPVGRGASMGALGTLRPNGDFDLALTIRTFAVADGRVHLWVGGGIVWDSEPEAEIEESWVKAGPLLGGRRRTGDRVTLLARQSPDAASSIPASPVFFADDEALLARRRCVRDGAHPGRRAGLLDRHVARLERRRCRSACRRPRCRRRSPAGGRGGGDRRGRA